MHQGRRILNVSQYPCSHHLYLPQQTLSKQSDRVVHHSHLPNCCFGENGALDLGSGKLDHLHIMQIPLHRAFHRLVWRIFLTVITGSIQSFSASIKFFSKINTLELVTNELELVGGGGWTTGLSVTNLHHGFEVSTHALFIKGRYLNSLLSFVKGNIFFHASISSRSNHPQISVGSCLI